MNLPRAIVDFARAMLQIEQSDAQNWKKTGDVHHPHSLYLTGDLLPETDNGSDVGSSTLGWGGVFLSSVGFLNWGNGAASITHASGVLTVGAGIARPFNDFNANDATPSVATGYNFYTANSNPTTITAFDDGADGREIFVKIGDSNTTIDFTGTTLKGNGGVDWTPASGDFMRCTHDGTNWLCQITEV